MDLVGQVGLAGLMDLVGLVGPVRLVGLGEPGMSDAEFQFCDIVAKNSVNYCNAGVLLIYVLFQARNDI